MDYRELTPKHPLSRFINKVWFLSCPSVHKQEKILPLPVHHFIINLSDEQYKVVQQGDEVRSWVFADGFVSGIQSRYLIIENPALIRHVGVELKPYGLSAFTSHAPEKYANIVLASESVFPGSTQLARELRQMSDPDQQLNQLLDFMTEKLKADYVLPRYVEASLPFLDTMAPIADIAQRVGVSHKQLTQQWNRYTGVSPKHYQNIVRLQQVVRWFGQANKPVRWSILASELSYCDQPHFIRTFRTLTGFSPREYAQMLERYPSGDQSFVALDDTYTG